MSDVRQWLSGLGLERYADAFEREEIALDDLPELTDPELKDLGLPLGPRKAVLRAATGLHTGQTPASLVAEKQAFNGADRPGSDAQAERRQLTVMFCDLVGSTALSQRLDPEELRRLIRQYQDACVGAITRFEGHVAQYLGDGVLAYFGYPVALEGGAERAIRAGLAVIERVRELSAQRDQPLQVRIGIDTGLVVIGRGEALSEQERTAVGDAPNIAARLQGLAAPGSVVLSERTRQLALGAFEFRDLGAHALKGISQPVHAWEVAGERAAETRFDAATGGLTAPMVGREMELELALRAWQQARQGRLQVLLLCGEAGIGKSRIVRALRERLSPDGAQTWQYQCSPYFINSALYPITVHMERALRFERDEPQESRLQKLEAMVIGEFDRPGLEVNLLGRLFNLPVEAKYGPLAMSPQKQKDETLRALAELVQAASRKQPILVLFEDMHWADPTTLEAVDQLLKRADTRALVAMTYRPEFKPVWIGQPHVTALTLGRLDPEQIETVVTRVAQGKPLPKEIVAQIVAKTDGVPLFVEELTKAILESHLVDDKGTRYELAGPLLTLAIPNSLRDSLMARLDRLAPVKEVAQIGACIGREFSDELLALISPLSRSQLSKALEQLTASELVFKRGSGKDTVYVFKHALVRDSAYESLLKSRRHQVHLRIAETIVSQFETWAEQEPELPAQHFAVAGRHLDSARYWLRAGHRALAVTALTEARTQFELGLEQIESVAVSDERSRVELGLRSALGTTLMALLGWADKSVGQALRPAVPLAKTLRDDSALASVLWGIWLNLAAQGSLSDSLKVIGEMHEAAHGSATSEVEVTSLVAATGTYFWMAKHREAWAARERLLAAYEPARHGHIVNYTLHAPRPVVHLWAGAYTKWITGYPDQSLDEFAQLIDRARRIAHPFDLVFSLTMGGFPLGHIGQADRLMLCAHEARAITREHGLRFLENCLVESAAGFALVASGEYDEGYRRLKAGNDAWRAAGIRNIESYYRGLQAAALLKLGRGREAMEAAGEAILSGEQFENYWALPEAIRLKGEIALALDAEVHDEAGTLFRQAIALSQDQGAKTWELRATTSLARLWAAQGERQMARDALTRIYDWFTEGFDTPDLKEARALLDELEVGA